MHGCRSDLGRECPAALAGPEYARDLFRRQMIGMGHPRAGTEGARVRRHQLVARGIETHRLAASRYPLRLAHQAKGRRVKGLRKDHLAIAMELDALPDRQV